MNEIQIPEIDVEKIQKEILSDIEKFFTAAALAKGSPGICKNLRLAIAGFTILQKQSILESALKVQALQVVARDIAVTRKQKRITDGSSKVD